MTSTNGLLDKNDDYTQDWIEKTTQCTFSPILNGDDQVNNFSKRSQRKRKKVREPRYNCHQNNWLDKTNSQNAEFLSMYAKYLSNSFHTPHNTLPLPNSNHDFTCHHCRFTANAQFPVPPLMPTPVFSFPHNGPTKCNRIQDINQFNGQKRKSKKKNPFKLENEACQINIGSRETKPSVNGMTDFSSLPPTINEAKNNSSSTSTIESKDNRRRFSDPGLASHKTNVKKADEGYFSKLNNLKCDSNAHNSLIACLVDHINLLKECNANLHKELDETKGELGMLKQQFSIWKDDAVLNQSQLRIRPIGSSIGSNMTYAPGMLADLVREIRDAAKIREEALYNKVRVMLEEKTSNVKSQTHTPPTEKNKINERLLHLEEQLQNLKLIQSKDNMTNYSYPNISMSTPVRSYSQIDPDHLRLQLELNNERQAHAHADARAKKLEMLVTQLQSKRNSSNYTPVHTNGATTPEPRHLVMGPITDL